MSINVVHPGLATSVQDLGRKGYFHLGIPVSGAMDRFACRCANWLVGNDENAAVLEAVFMGPKLTFNRDTTVAVTGAEMAPIVDGEEQTNWASFTVKAGQTLSFSHLTGGARIYIAVAGGIDVPEVLGSRSTYTLGALGGFEGRLLQADDTLPIGKESARFVERHLPEALRRPRDTTLRVVPGLYWHRITAASGEQFFNDTWQVAPEADRIGYRFKNGTPLEFVEREQPFGAGSDPSNIVDGCYPYGSIQVPAGKEPIVLHRDAVSGGGYFMIGTVVSVDMDLIGQMQPNASTQFVKVTLEDALHARKEYDALLQQAKQHIERCGVAT
ncbi:biotin-dependent carboxyltransferase family protein [Enterovibrio sp. ZSDZ35]|uniref:Biotin-dependent carboxyltransferase family protein n=1 Tax=Enterovibrio qingdaonensis TaxID=2899818 RepID=A0ABT5QHV1_9GAMM|nr:biotin-dependent carboxyltransferase family protein [Enterovibrio sp. ZSDZ35]MDD1780561.1 biotin-dependent carboxyltransferase family protein [Enterovibrio sp. ZSDZ35]